MSQQTNKIRRVVIIAGNLIFIYGLYLFTQGAQIALPVCLTGFVLIIYGWFRFRPEANEL